MTPEDLDKMAADWVKAHYCLRLTPMIEATGRDMAAFARAVAAAVKRDDAVECRERERVYDDEGAILAMAALARKFEQQADALAPRQEEAK
jgi:hypothetical protein